jgi:O-antigen ligase
LAERKIKKKISYLLATIFLLLGLIFTLERSVWLGLGAVIATNLLINRRSLGVLFCSVIILGLLFCIFPELRHRLKTMGQFKNYAISSRIHQWQGGLEMMLDHPLTGVGPGNYDIIYKQYKFFKERKTYSHAHSNIVQTGAELGMLGMAMFFWIMVSAFRFILAKIRQINEPLTFSFCIGALAACLGYNFAGLFEYNFGDSEVQLLFWFIIAVSEKV